MNIVDYIILGIAGLALMIGLMRGLIGSLKHLAGILIAGFLTGLLYPVTARFLQAQEGLTNALRGFFEKNEVIAELAGLAAEPVQNVMGQIDAVISQVQLPAIVTEALENAMRTQAFGGQATVATYALNAAVMVTINLLAFVLTLAAMSLLTGWLLNLLHRLFRSPGLRQFDSLAGGALGLVIAFVVCTVLLALVPVVAPLISTVDLMTPVEESMLAGALIGNPLADAINDALAQVF